MNSKQLIFAILIFATAVSASARQRVTDDDNDHRIARISTTKNVEVTVCIASGNIITRGWDKNEVLIDSDGGKQVELRRRDGTEGDSPAGAVEAQISDLDEEGHPSAPGCSSTGDVTLNVPRNARLVLKTIQGDIDVDGAAEAQVESASGNMTVRNVPEGVDLNTAAGDLTVENSGGRIRLRSMSGDIFARDLKPRDPGDNLSINSASGDVRLARIGQRNVEVRSISGGVSIDGPLAKGGRYQLNTVNGDISFELPPDSSFHLSGRVFQGGDIVTDFPLKYGDSRPQSKLSKGGSIEGAFGTGDAMLDLMSTSGTIRLRKKR
jgi:DUF4097 and DUF4098 domain-containing protein YvlB